MGASLSSLKIFVSVIVLLISSNNASAKPTSFLLGLAGTGKSTAIGNLCGTKLFTDNDIFAATKDELAVDCGEQYFVDTCGLVHLPDDESPVENAFHRGLEKLLSYMDGKEIGKIYVVISGSGYIRDFGRLLEQVDFIKSIVNPLIPWVSVINCIHGVCPSTLPPAQVPQVIGLLAKKTSSSIEVNALTLTPADKGTFPVPKTTYMVNLPPNWRELIEKHDIASIRKHMTEKAIASCKEHQDAFIAASSAIKDHQCALPVCPAPNCKELPACPEFFCDVPRCGNGDTCRTVKVTKTSCGPYDVLTCKNVEEGVDSSCLDAITQCNTARARSCDAQLEGITQCNAERTAQCVSLQDAQTTCNTQRTTDCAAELNAVKTTHTATMEQHKPYVDQCQKFYTMK